MSSQKPLSANISALFSGVKDLGVLYFEKARLKTTEKITILLATVAYSAVIMALGLVCLVFVSIGIGHLLATTLAPHLAYLIIAAFYLIVFILAIVFRRRLFVDPIARFMSRLLVEKPEEIREAERKAEEVARASKNERIKTKIDEILSREELALPNNETTPETDNQDENIN
ncbi:MAG: phage holin family protein [Muribaculaceae bacterium]|nr:phage holin family protein [Muribaculaceae bacterium]